VEKVWSAANIDMTRTCDERERNELAEELPESVAAELPFNLSTNNRQ
jgi:hypothetical protein